MGFDKGHKEFHALDMGEGWHALPGYPAGIQEKRGQSGALHPGLGRHWGGPGDGARVRPRPSVGGGVKIALSPGLQLRLEAHDFLSPFPKNVIAPSPGSTVGGWLQDFVVMAGLSFTF